MKAKTKMKNQRKVSKHHSVLNTNKIKLKQRVNRWIKFAFAFNKNLLLFCFVLFVCFFLLCDFSPSKMRLFCFEMRNVINWQLPLLWRRAYQEILNYCTIIFVRLSYGSWCFAYEIHTSTKEYIISFLITAAVTEKYYYRR